MKFGLGACATIALICAVLTPTAAPAVPPAHRMVRAGAGVEAVLPFDFNGDGFADLAIGAPGESFGARRQAGQVHVVYGSADPASGNQVNQVWSQRTKGVPGIAERRDAFGSALASADFNADGFADLAVGVPGESRGSAKYAGAVNVLYGSARGLRARGSQLWHQGSKGVPGRNGDGDQFGGSLATGDFDGDGYADLAISVPGDRDWRGRVVVLRGSPARLTRTGVQSLAPAAAANPRNSGEIAFGASVAAGDFNADGRDDLAITAPGAPHGGTLDIMIGSPTGLVVSGAPLTGAGLGITLTSWPTLERELTRVVAGDFNADGLDDLAVASRQVTGGVDLGAEMGGTVAVLYSEAGSFIESSVECWRLDPCAPGSVNLPGASGWFDWFGQSLAVGDFTSDGVADLAIGAQHGDAAGWVYILVGSPSGLRWTSMLIGPEVDLAEPDPSFAGSLAALQFSGGPGDWLLVGDPQAPVDGVSAGRALVWHWRPDDMSAGGLFWTQGPTSLRGNAEDSDRFGVVGPGSYGW